MMTSFFIIVYLCRQLRQYHINNSQTQYDKQIHLYLMNKVKTNKMIIKINISDEIC